MKAVGMSRAQAVGLVRRIMSADCSDEDVRRWLAGLDRALVCPSGHVGDLIYGPSERELSAEEVVDQALAYQPIGL
ncbi:e9imm peptide [Streptomyces sp. NPDC058001]|uniref:e9imm peptide n=1 Tax=Streptomyces sp. NPDC058001 TaxID=3346300 RepID=UPI0036EBE5D3